MSDDEDKAAPPPISFGSDDDFTAEPISIGDIVADPGVAPQSWQSKAPDYLFTGSKPAVTNSEELQRIMAIPRRPQLDPDSDRALKLVQLMTRRYRRERTTPCRCAELAPKRFLKNPNACIKELNVAQAWVLYEAGIVQGWDGAVGVGHGKTLIDILGALALCDAWAFHRQRAGLPVNREEYKVLLLVPPGLQAQLWDEYQLLAEHFRVPTIVFRQIPGRQAVVSGEPRLVVMPYSTLSRPNATTFMRALAPHAIIADESHNISNPDSTRGSRVGSYVDEFPETLMGQHTGSMTEGSITDYSKLSAMALKARSPVPIDVMVAREWASCLDPDDRWRADPGALLQALIDNGFMSPGENIYLGFQRRLVETMGFIATRDSAIDAGLDIVERTPSGVGDTVSLEGDDLVPNVPRADPSAPDGEGWPGVRDCLAMIRNGVRPDGEELLEDGTFVIARHAREMASGFFYRWVFPRGEPPELVARWRTDRKSFFCAIREKLGQRAEHLDSPYLLKAAAMRYFGDLPREGIVQVFDDVSNTLRPVDMSQLPVWDSMGTWPAWRDVEKLVKPVTEPVWIDEFLALDAVEWAEKHRGIVWYDHDAFGRKIGELGGLNVHGGGPDAGQKLVGGEYRGKRYPGEDGQRSIVCSIKSHGTGRNGLQFLFDEMLLANPPSSNEGWEQVLARLHRIGQSSSKVTAYFYQHTAEVRKHVAQALRRAFYVASTLGSNQKLRIGFKLSGEDQ